MRQTYCGGCQCGKVRYEATFELAEVVACNCSLCGRLGSMYAFMAEAQFKLISGESAMTEYQFNKHVIHYLFCSTCGIQSFARGRGGDGANVVAVNVRCLDDIDVDSLKVKKIDGRRF